MELQIRVEGLDEAIKRLKKTPRILKKARVRAMDASAKLLHAKVARYPPAPAGSSYQRTGTLGRTWVSGVETAPRIRGYVENPTSYAPHVVGDETQAWMHKGRWVTIGRQAQKLQGKMEKIHQSELNKAVKEIER